MQKLEAKPADSLLSPANHTLLMLDFQPQMAFPVRSIDVTVLRTNAAMVAETAAGFGVSTILSSIVAEAFSGRMIDEVRIAFPGLDILDRSTMNGFENEDLVARVNEIGKPRLVLAGLWTSACIAYPVLTALEQGFEVYVITDACGDVSAEAHERAVERMIGAGARPITAVTYVLELQRDWARAETYGMSTGIIAKRGGGYGLGVSYAAAMFGGQEG